MLIIALVLNMLGFGLFCWLGLTLAVYALPCFVALSAGLAAVHAGASIASAALVAILAGAVTILIGQTALIWARSSFVRAVIAAAFTVPAAVAGYHLAHGLSQIAMPSSLWREIFSWTGAFAIAGMAWRRITSFAEPPALGEALLEEHQ
ncbi:hypothetical protein [Bradyrhizobium monzae]|uniref:hypothetical protein n=1 Tax=Bradyrhizobium sp. Oc8 TaxID=2876780 RepID=UPI001F32E995|nr:hypothetical protein [Bradyrhizobium sp. Oc8]